MFAKSAPAACTALNPPSFLYLVLEEPTVQLAFCSFCRVQLDLTVKKKVLLLFHVGLENIQMQLLLCVHRANQEAHVLVGLNLRATLVTTKV